MRKTIVCMGTMACIMSAQALEHWEKPFDKDGDGVISAAERKVLKETIAKEKKENQRIKKQLLKQCDLDSDGKLNDEEAAQGALFLADTYKYLLKRFDADKNGMVNGVEINNAVKLMRRRYKI